MLESKFIIGTKENISEQEVVQVAKIVQGKEPKILRQALHSVATHNFHIRKYGRCMYCEFLGYGDPVPKAVILEKLR